MSLGQKHLLNTVMQQSIGKIIRQYKFIDTSKFLTHVHDFLFPDKTKQQVIKKLREEQLATTTLERSLSQLFRLGVLSLTNS